MQIGSKARLLGIKPELAVAVIIVESLYARRGLDAVLTSVTDRTHSEGSLHYSGNAFDLLGGTSVLRDEIKAALGQDFDVLFEHSPANPANDHIHVEYQPKKSMVAG